MLEAGLESTTEILAWTASDHPVVGEFDGRHPPETWSPEIAS